MSKESMGYLASYSSSVRCVPSGRTSSPVSDTPSAMQAWSLQESTGGLPVYVAFLRIYNAQRESGRARMSQPTHDVLPCLPAIAHPPLVTTPRRAVPDPIHKAPPCLSILRPRLCEYGLAQTEVRIDELFPVDSIMRLLGNTRSVIGRCVPVAPGNHSRCPACRGIGFTRDR